MEILDTSFLKPETIQAVPHRLIINFLQLGILRLITKTDPLRQNQSHTERKNADYQGYARTCESYIQSNVPFSGNR